MGDTAEKTPPYRLVSPEGLEIPVSRELWDAVQFFTQTKRAGSLQAHFRNGGIAGAEVNFKLAPGRQT